MMEGTEPIDELMRPVLAAIKRHVKNPDAITDIYNRAYEAVMKSMDVNEGDIAVFKNGIRAAERDAKLWQQRAEAAERENERLRNFYKQAMDVAVSIYAACTYQDEATAVAGNYGLPKKVWDALDKLIQDAHDLSDHKGEQK